MQIYSSLLAVLAIFPIVEGSSFLRAGQVTESEVKQSLQDEMQHAGDTTARMLALKEALLPTFNAVPKNSFGNLGHQAARYILHRMFVQRYGWFIRGLEPDNATWTGLVGKPPKKEWIPTYVQNMLESSAGDKGMDLNNLVAFAATLEDLARRESDARMETAYEIHGFDKSASMDMAEVKSLLVTYYMSFLLAGNLSAADAWDMERKKTIFARKYSGWQETETWLQGLEETLYAPEDGRHTFKATSNFASKIGQEYTKFNQLECSSLKKTMRDMETFKPGHVRLSHFYQKSLFSHWRFTEKAEYLRTLGALDESDPLQPQVITANYIMARPNCLEASSLYAICCRNECEELMSSVEKELGNATASPEQIASLVSALPSDTVEAPRTLSASLMQRLNQVAQSHDGKVPIHGRLFAQWMHHAYPRECPYPHLVGTTSPQTPDEWMRETGQNTQASQEEMQKLVASDTCMDADGKFGCTETQAGGSELPWSEAEELWASDHRPSGTVAGRTKAGSFEDYLDGEDLLIWKYRPYTPEPLQRKSTSGVWLAYASALCMASLLALDYFGALQQQRGAAFQVLCVDDPKAVARVFKGLRAAAGLWFAASMAWFLNMLDTTMFTITMFGGVVCLSLRRFGSQLVTGKSAKSAL